MKGPQTRIMPLGQTSTLEKNKNYGVKGFVLSHHVLKDVCSMMHAVECPLSSTGPAAPTVKSKLSNFLHDEDNRRTMEIKYFRLRLSDDCVSMKLPVLLK